MKLKGYYIIGIICILLFIAWTTYTGENIGHLRAGNKIISILLPSDIPNLTIFQQSIRPLASLRNGLKVTNLCVIWFFDPSKAFYDHYPVENIQIAVRCNEVKPLTLVYQKLGELPRYWIYVNKKPQISTKKEIMDVLERADKQEGI